MAGQLVASAVAGAGLEIVFSRFLKLVVDVQKNNCQFKSSLKRLEEMLHTMTPNIKKIESFNKELDRPKEIDWLKGLMEKGTDLVLKCKKVRRYNCVMRPIYNKKLLKLEKAIRDYISSVLQVQVTADTKEILYTQNSTLVAVKDGVGQLSDQIGQLSMSLSNGSWVDSSKRHSNTSLGVCSPPELKLDPVGWEIPLSELRIKLLKDETSPHVVLCASGGCGKTTLATALCQHGDVKGKPFCEKNAASEQS